MGSPPTNFYELRDNLAVYLAYNWPFGGGGSDVADVQERVLDHFASEPSEFGAKLVPTAARCTHRVAKVYNCAVTYEDGQVQHVTVDTAGGTVRVVGSD